METIEFLKMRIEALTAETRRLNKKIIEHEQILEINASTVSALIKEINLLKEKRS